jgi:hypothetical protein
MRVSALHGEASGGKTVENGGIGHAPSTRPAARAVRLVAVFGDTTRIRCPVLGLSIIETGPGRDVDRTCHRGHARRMDDVDAPRSTTRSSGSSDPVSPRGSVSSLRRPRN